VLEGEETAVKKGSRVLRCAGDGCTKEIRVGMGVAWILCAACQNRLASVWTKLAKKKAAAR
jgi:hypothetical protein